MSSVSVRPPSCLSLDESAPSPQESCEGTAELAGSVLTSSFLRCEFSKRYDVVFLDGLLNPHQPYLADLLANRRALLVTTPTVARLYGAQLRALIDSQALDLSVLELTCTERDKNLDLVSRVCVRALELDIDRRGVLIGWGGGVCTDLVTVAASWIRRGIAHIRIPTTLVGQIDAGIGIKGGVNFYGKKSFLGCFHPPETVLIDPLFLRSLPIDSLRCGLAEILKIALVRDAALFDLVEAHASSFLASGFTKPRAAARTVLWRAADGMLQELAANAYENQSYQRLVDFGHTLSPLLEAVTQFTLPHGQAVAIDMALSAVLSSELGWMRPAVRERILSVIVAAGLPIFSAHLTPALCRKALREASRHRGGAPNLVLPVAVGNATFLERADDLPPATLERAIQLLGAIASGAR